jgi:hypothetical protein
MMPSTPIWMRRRIVSTSFTVHATDAALTNVAGGQSISSTEGVGTGSVLIAALTATFLTGIAQNPAVPKEVTSQATVLLATGAPFISDDQLQHALDQAGVPASVSTAVIDENAAARISALRAALAVFYALGGPTLETADDLVLQQRLVISDPAGIVTFPGGSLAVAPPV